MRLLSFSTVEIGVPVSFSCWLEFFLSVNGKSQRLAVL